MEKILSKSGELLHVVVRKADLSHDRLNVSGSDEPMQVGGMRIESGKSFPPHVHKPRESVIRQTQECWFVIEGVVEVTYYDEEGEMLDSRLLCDGDCSITYKGGHGYEALCESLVWEAKNGPYLGAEADKEHI